MEKLSQSKIDQLIKTFRENIEAGKSETEAQDNALSVVKSNIEQKAILGIDFYRYNKYRTVQQILIPLLFKQLFEITILNCYNHEGFIFQTLKKSDLKDCFIDTGDGGYVIFQNPLQATVFAIYFQANIKRYNSGHIMTQDYRDIIGQVALRYCLTLDDIYYLNNNFYGTGIINNARILSKDRLNRFLVDSNTIQWYDKILNGVENLTVLHAERDFDHIEFFKKYNLLRDDQGRLSVLFDNDSSRFIATDVLHIGEIKSKLDMLNIYSLHIQIKVSSGGGTNFQIYTITIGNLNSTGLS